MKLSDKIEKDKALCDAAGAYSIRSKSHFINDTRSLSRSFLKYIEALEKACEALKWYADGMPYLPRNNNYGHEKICAQKALGEIEKLLLGDE